MMSSPTGAAGSPVAGGRPQYMTLSNGQRVPTDQFGLPKRGRVPISAVQEQLLASAEAYAQAASRAWTDAGFVASEYAPTVLLSAQGCAPLAMEATFVGPDGKTNPVIVNPGELTGVDYYDAAEMSGTGSTAGVRFLTVNDGRLQACVRNPTMKEGYISPEEREEAAKTLQRMFSYYGIKSELDRAEREGGNTNVKSGLNLLGVLGSNQVSGEGKLLSASLSPGDRDALERHLKGQLKSNRDLRIFARSLTSIELSLGEAQGYNASKFVEEDSSVSDGIRATAVLTTLNSVGGQWSAVKAALTSAGAWQRFLNGEKTGSLAVDRPKDVLNLLVIKLAVMVTLCAQGKFDRAGCTKQSICSVVSVRNDAGEAIDMCFPQAIGSKLSDTRYPKDEAVRQGRWWVQEARRATAADAHDAASLGARLGLGSASALSGGDAEGSALFHEFMGGKKESPSSLDGGDDQALRVLFGGVTRGDRVEY